MGPLIVAAETTRAYISRHLYRRVFATAESISSRPELGPPLRPCNVGGALGPTWPAVHQENCRRRTASAGGESTATIYRHMIAELDAVAELAFVGLGDADPQGDATEPRTPGSAGKAFCGRELGPASASPRFTDTNQIDKALRQIQVVQSHSGAASTMRSKTKPCSLIQPCAQLMVMQGDLGGAERLLDARPFGPTQCLGDRSAQRAWFALVRRGRIGAGIRPQGFEEATPTAMRGRTRPRSASNPSA
jgi:hypothetical protein